MSRLLALALFAATPAFAADLCPADLSDADSAFSSAQADWKDARQSVYGQDWNARIATADDRDEALAAQDDARVRLREARSARRDARRSLREARRSHDDAPEACLSNGFAPLAWLRGA